MGRRRGGGSPSFRPRGRPRRRAGGIHPAVSPRDRPRITRPTHGPGGPGAPQGLVGSGGTRADAAGSRPGPLRSKGRGGGRCPSYVVRGSLLPGWTDCLFLPIENQTPCCFLPPCTGRVVFFPPKGHFEGQSCRQVYERRDCGKEGGPLHHCLPAPPIASPPLQPPRGPWWGLARCSWLRGAVGIGGTMSQGNKAWLTF